MKGFNVFLAIVIFLLAATSAVFSYFLFEKRASLVTGHGYFAKHLTEATQKLEKGSGTTLSQSITEQTLNHDKGPKIVNDQLTEFNKLVAAVIDERDTLAAAMEQISRSIRPALKKNEFISFKTYKSASARLIAQAQEYRQRNDWILNSLVQSGKRLGTKKLSKGALESKNYKDSYRELNDRIAYWNGRHNTYVSQVKAIGQALKYKGSTPSVSAADYEKSLKALVKHADKVEKERLSNYRSWQRTEGLLKQEKEKVEKLEAQIKEQAAKINSLNLDIKRLETMLGIKPSRRAIKSGSKEALELVKTQQKGKVIEVNEKFGFVVISLGKKTVVQDYYEYKPTNESPLQTRKWDVDPIIAQGMVLTVARDMPSGSAEYINKIKIVKLDDHCAIAESVDNKTGKPMLRGDLVYLSDDEIAKWVKNRK